ncbi:B9 domain containing protein, partial [Kipferlia bialata]
GYGVVRLPMEPGRSRVSVDIFSPKMGGMMDGISDFFAGVRPEFTSVATLASGVARHTTKTSSGGKMFINLDVAFAN